MKKMSSLIILVATATCAFGALERKDRVDLSEPFQIAKDGLVQVEIIIENDPHPALIHAARELQLGLKMIVGTAAKMPQGRPVEMKANHIYLGRIGSPLIGERSEDAEALKGNDGFAIRRVNNNLFIYASGYRGIINGVHRLLYLNTDLIWARPMKEMAVYSENPNLALTETDMLDIPKFTMRGWGGNRDVEYQRWCSRNLLNDNNLTSPVDATRFKLQQMEFDFPRTFGGGHNLTHIWMPAEKYATTNPDFYAMVDGKRRAQGHSHICVSNAKMRETFIRDALETISTIPSSDVVNIMQDDWDIGCGCPECQKPITLPDGSTLTPDDRAFKSTQWFMFLNEVAEAIHKKYPEHKIRVFAYQSSAIPPKVKVFDTMIVNFCPVPVNAKQPLLGGHPSNLRWKQDVDAWGKVTRNLRWREYYYCFKAFPHPIADNVAADLRYLSTNNIAKEIYSEHNYLYDTDKTLEISSWNTVEKTSELWSMNACEIWTLNHIFWDPLQDVGKLRDEYRKRAYREAAPYMKEFDELIREVWNEDPATVASVNENQYVAMGYYVLNKNIDGKCRAALTKAEQAAVHPVSKELIKRIRATFEKWIAAAPSLHDLNVKIPKAETKNFPSFDFTSGVWEAAADFPEFNEMGSRIKRATYQTAIKAFHDGRHLYLGIQCFDPEPKTFRMDPAGQKRDIFPGGEHIELFISNNEVGYYQLAYDIRGNIYDAAHMNAEWNGDWEVKTHIDEKGWLSVVRLPFTMLDLDDLSQNNIVKGLVFRSRNNTASPGMRELSTWGGDTVHDSSSFGELILVTSEEAP